MIGLVLLIGIVVSTLGQESTEQADKRCGPNQQYNQCGACVPSCRGPNVMCAAACLGPRCDCKPGYYISPNGTCVLPEECPTDPPCDNDPNQRFSACASPCQPTCDFPVPACNRTCHSPGCECLPGFLRNDYKCIPLKSCPGASQCKANEEFSSCKAECPNDYCPVNDSRGVIACDPSYPCPSGCTCKYGYLRKSETEPICIKATNCPPVKCTRPNEVWSPRVPKCLVERCEDLDDPSQACYSPYRDIMPRCICKKGYYRNSEDICVPKSQCRKCD